MKTTARLLTLLIASTACPALARYYDPGTSRFLPNAQAAGNALSLHRYAYARGNPLKYTDPSGNCPWCAVAGAVVGFGVGFGAAMLDDASLRDALVAGGIGAVVGGMAGLTMGASLVVEGTTTLGVIAVGGGAATKAAVGVGLDVMRQGAAVESGRQARFSYREAALAAGVSIAVPGPGQAPNVALALKAAGVGFGSAGVAVAAPEAVAAAARGDLKGAVSAGIDTLLSGAGVHAGWSPGQPDLFTGIGDDSLTAATPQTATRPATQQPTGGGGVVLRDAQGATPAEMEASVGGTSAGSRVGQAAARQALLDEAPPGEPYSCWRCGETSTNPADMHLGHRNVPTSKGGNLAPENICLEGAACNLSAGNRGAPSQGMSCAERGSGGAPYGR